jgi:hypothetical protein
MSSNGSTPGQAFYARGLSQTQPSTPASPTSTNWPTRPIFTQAAALVGPETEYYTNGAIIPRLPAPGFKDARCLDAITPDDSLPERQTCPMPYHRDAGIDREEHCGNAGSKFYVVCPGRTQGTYNLECVCFSAYVHPRCRLNPCLPPALVRARKSRVTATAAPSQSIIGRTRRRRGPYAASAGTVRSAPTSVRASR